MFDSNSLTEEETVAIRSWVEEGAQLSDLQKKMEDDLGHRLTYMDTRFLVLDLGLELKTEEPEVEEEPEEELAAEKDVSELTEDDVEVVPQEPSTGDVHVTLDQVTRPGVMASGRVTFGDGQGGAWYVDQMGRLGVDPDTEGYRPGEADLLAFQRELQRVVG